MKNKKVKCLFNSATFLLAGIISIIRVEQMEMAISFLFFGIFIFLGISSKRSERKILSEKYN